MSKILIVEDDEKLRSELEIFLKNNGYEVSSLKSFNNTINEILEINPNVVLLDINLPGADGEYICKEIRKQSNMGIIMVTSRESELDELISINYGADHYITKPYNIQILLAKIASLLRRKDSNAIKDKIELTKNEYKILKYLIENRGKIVSREDIMECLWESESFIDDNTLSVNITRLRNKLEELDLKELIETKRGQGYILKGEN